MSMHCPMGYFDEVPPACQLECPIKKGIKVNEKWHSVITATSSGGIAYGKMTVHGLNNAVKRKKIPRDPNRREINGYHKYKGHRRGIPECAVIAYMDYQYKRARRGEARREKVARRKEWFEKRKVMQLFMGVTSYNIRGEVEAMLRERDTRIAMGLPSLNQTEIGLFTGVSRQRVSQIKKGMVQQ